MKRVHKATHSKGRKSGSMNDAVTSMVSPLYSLVWSYLTITDLKKINGTEMNTEAD